MTEVTRPKRSVLISRWYVFLLLALLGRGLYIIIQVNEFKEPGTISLWARDGDDTVTYLEPIENLLAGKGYTPDYRMPGIGMPYLVFRLFFSEAVSRDAVIILQWLFSALSVYVLALISLRITNSDRVSIAVFGIFLISTYSSWYDSFLISDSLAVSTLIIHIYAMQRAMDTRRAGWFAVAGLLLTWFIFLRPVGIALFPMVLLLMFLHYRSKAVLKPVLILLLPFLLIDGIWTYRNYSASGKLMPLTNQGLLPASFMDSITGRLMVFVQGYGGNYIWWKIGSDMRWFGVCLDYEEIDGCGVKADPPPAHAYVSAYNLDSLQVVREKIRLVRGGTLTTGDSLALKAEVIGALDRYAAAYRAEAPVQYYFLSRIRMIANQFVQNGSETLWSRPWAELNVVEKVFRLLQSGIYAFAALVGTIAALLIGAISLFKRQQIALEWSAWSALFLLFVYPIGLLMCEWRYMVHPFPLLLMLGVQFVAWMAGRGSWTLEGTIEPKFRRVILREKGSYIDMPRVHDISQ
jgi:uncharacterized protein YqgC (DUF456 family)